MQVPVNVMEDRLFGSVDVKKTLETGQTVFTPVSDDETECVRAFASKRLSDSRADSTDHHVCGCPVEWSTD